MVALSMQSVFWPATLSPRGYAERASRLCEPWALVNAAICRALFGHGPQASAAASSKQDAAPAFLSCLPAASIAECNVSQLVVAGAGNVARSW